MALSPADESIVARQLERTPRGALRVAHRCPCGNPDVVRTAPRLPDGTPFPTLYYVTCPRLAAQIGRLESEGVMRALEDRLATDDELASAYHAAHEAYLADRKTEGFVAEIDGISAGGMPNRVKCLHVLVAHALATENPLGEEVLLMLEPWWTQGPCVQVDA